MFRGQSAGSSTYFFQVLPTKFVYISELGINYSLVGALL